MFKLCFFIKRKKKLILSFHKHENIDFIFPCAFYVDFTEQEYNPAKWKNIIQNSIFICLKYICIFYHKILLDQDAIFQIKWILNYNKINFFFLCPETDYLSVIHRKPPRHHHRRLVLSSRSWVYLNLCMCFIFHLVSCF